MSDLALVLTTADSERLCLRIASALVEQKLAACVNIVKSVRSIYRWKDKIHDDEEFVLLVKTLREALPEVRRTIKELHTYDLPDIVALPIVDADPPVAEWIAGCVRRPEPASS
jgi:periplasmic divalent cation tolerance protein